VDARIIDGLGVNGSANVTLGLSHVSSWFDRVFVDRIVNGVADVLQAAFRRNRETFQTGRTQNYALTMAVGIFGLVCFYLVLS
jgi:hypothetical protein